MGELEHENLPILHARHHLCAFFPSPPSRMYSPIVPVVKPSCRNSPFKLQIHFFCRAPLVPFSYDRCSKLWLLLTRGIFPSSDWKHQDKIPPWTYHITFYKILQKALNNKKLSKRDCGAHLHQQVPALLFVTSICSSNARSEAQPHIQFIPLLVTPNPKFWRKRFVS